MSKQGNTGRSTRATRQGQAAAPAEATPPLLPGSQVIDESKPFVIGSVPTPPSDEEAQVELDTSPLDETPAVRRQNPNMPAWANAGQLAAEQPAPAPVQLAPEQDFSGSYVALARLNFDDGRDAVPHGVVVELTDAEARHFLKSKVVRSTAEHAANGSLEQLPAHQNFAGAYYAIGRLNLESGERVDPGKRVVLSDAEARHFLKSGVIKSATGYQL